VTGTSLLPLSTLAGTIKAHIAAGDKAVGKADEHYTAAGIHLLEAKERVKRTANLTWPAFLVSQCSIQRSRADELIAIAEGRTSLAEVRERTKNKVAAHRASAKQSPLRNGRSEEIVQSEQPPLLLEGEKSHIEKLKKQLAAAKEKIEEKEGQRQSQESRAEIAVKQVRDATSRAMFAESDKERLQAEVDRLTEENDRLRTDSLQLDDSAIDIAEKLIEMDDQKKLSKVAKLINDHLRHPERSEFQRQVALGRIKMEGPDGRRIKADDLPQHSWRVEAVDASGQRWRNDVHLDTEAEARIYADAFVRKEIDGCVTADVIRVPGQPVLHDVTMSDDGTASISFPDGMCSRASWSLAERAA
jgi:hypothetical protein